MMYQACLAEALMQFALAFQCLEGYEWIYSWPAVVYAIPALLTGSSLHDITTPTPQQKWNIFALVVVSNLVQFAVGLMLAVYLNSILLIDILLTLRNPFKPYEQRYQLFTYGSVILALVVGVFVVGADKNS